MMGPGGRGSGGRGRGRGGPLEGRGGGGGRGRGPAVDGRGGRSGGREEVGGRGRGRGLGGGRGQGKPPGEGAAAAGSTVDLDMMDVPLLNENAEVRIEKHLPGADRTNPEEMFVFYDSLIFSTMYVLVDAKRAFVQLHHARVDPFPQIRWI